MHLTTRADAPPRPMRAILVGVVAALAVASAYAAPSDDGDAISRFVERAAATIAPAVGQPADAGSGSDGDTTASSQPGLLRQVHDRASEMATSALEFLGVHYRRGGQSAETGFDCSGFTRHVFELSGLDLPRRAEEQARAKGLVAVKLADLRPGDLVFFKTMKQTFSHVGIYLGENRFIHAPSHGKTVRTDDIGFAYWAKRFTGARRAEPEADAQPVLAGSTPPATQPTQAAVPAPVVP